MSPLLQAYVVCWSSLCLLAGALVLQDRKTFFAEWHHYARFLCVPWKLAVFAPALVFVTFAGRYTNDETWDVVSGGGMSVLTFLTAPWSIGTCFKVIRGERPARLLVVALALWQFSSCGFYDGYLYVRDGAYSSRWFGNLLLSPFIYLCAGLLWNLEARSRWLAALSFLRRDWPAPPEDARFGPIVLMGLPFAIAGFVVLVAFVRWPGL